jgi:hypothetical protein
MKYGGFTIICDICGSHYVHIVHRQRCGEEFEVLICNDCKQEATL